MKHLRHVALAASLCCCSHPAVTQDFDYDARRAPELRSCDQRRERGRVNEARQCYVKLMNGAGDTLVRAEAAWGTGDLRAANERFRIAVESDSGSARPRERWGRLFLQTHQYADAMKLFGEALEIDPEDTQTLLAMARLYADSFEGQARTLVDELLEKDDGLIEAQLLSARMDLEGGRLPEAERALKKAIDAAGDQQRPPLEAYALMAAHDLLRGDATAKRWTDRALDYNPRFGGVFETLAHFEIMRRRYTEATAWLRRAIDVQPDLWSAHAELGVNLLRVGNVEEARSHLQTAYQGDPFSATTVNTLRLLDSLKDFSVDTVTAPDLRMQLHRKEAGALRPYVEELSRASIAAFSQRYGFQPRQPITVELYPDHDDFAVRTAGLPGIGLLGVTFGYLVAMDSPSGRPPGDFHWGSTLWHEMAHVFTLAVTGHRVPRWLSEGISVFEEWRTGPTPGVAVPPQVLMAFRDDRFLPVADLDEGFIRPTYEDQVQVSYMQAGLICLFIEQRWGFGKLVELLRQFTRDTTTRAAVESTLKVGVAEFDREFKAFVQQRFAGFLADPERWQESMEAAHRAVKEENWKEAIAAAQRAVELYPEYTAQSSAHLILARAFHAAGQRNEAIAVLQRYRQLGGWDPAALRQLAQWLDEAGRRDELPDVLTAINYVDPFDQANHALLGEDLLNAGRAAEARREFEVLLALDPHDKAVPNFGLARALRLQGDAVGGRRHLLDALEIAPHYKPAQDLLLELTGERTDE